MGASADFEGILTHLVGADFLAVFALEQADGALVFGFLHSHLFHDNGNLGIDGHINQTFNFGNFFRRHFPAEGEVETETFGGDVGALLGNFITQDLAQGSLEQVGGSVQLGGFFIPLGQTALGGAFLLTDGLVLLERFGKAIGVHGEALFSSQFFSQLQRETVGIVETESLLAADFSLGLVGRILLGHELILAADAGDALGELFHAGSQGRFEAGGFLHDFVQDIVFLFHQQRVSFIIDLLNEDPADLGQDGGFQTQLTGVADSAAEQAAQDVAGAHIGGQDALHIADEHCGGADVVRDDTHGLLGIRIIVIALAGLFFQVLDDRDEQVGLVAVGHAVQEGQHTVETEAGIHVLVRQGSIAVGVLDVLHVHVVTDLDIPSAAAGRSAVRAAGLVVTGVEPLVVGTAGGAGGAFQLPPVIALGQVEDVLRQDADFLQQVRGFIIPGSGVIAFKNGGADFLAVQAKDLGQQVVTPLGFFLLEIIAQGPVAHHLKEGEMGGVADTFNIHGTDAALYIAQALLSGRMLLAQQIRHQGLHAGHVEHDAGGSVADERDGSDIDMSPFFIKTDPGISQFLGRDSFHNCQLSFW